MIHRDAVANRYRAHFKWNAAGGADTFFNRFGNDIQVHVPRNNLIVAVDNADERLFHVVPAHTAGMQ